MKKRLISMAMVAGLSVCSAGAQEEDYKTYRPNIRYTAGVSTGMGKINTQEGLALVGNVAARILENGFVPDIVNPVFIEAQFGPTFAEGESLWQYSTHLRWDFIRNSQWTFFAVGGLAGNFYDNPKFGSSFDIYPRFGLGTFLALDYFDVRAEISHEMILGGVSFPF